MNYEIVESFAQMVREKGIDRDILAGIVEDVFGMMMRKKYGPEAKFDVVVNLEKGDIEIYLEKEVVETVTDPNIQIDIETARSKSDEDLQPGDEFVEIVDLSSFGRRLVVSGKQNLNQRIKEIEKELIYNEYTGSLGEIVVGEIYQLRKNEILVNHNRNELILPKSEQIFKERYKKGETVRAIIKEVRKNSGNPVVIISRADTKFLEKLFEIEIPEIYDGVIEIKTLAREPGERAKVAVLSHDDRIDAVGACVGMKGVRIHSIVRELNNENIDVINYSNDPTVFITRALAPAKIKHIEIDEKAKTANVLVPNDQMSLLIGRNGQNIRLASKLTGFTINPIKEKPDVEYDIELSEFQEEIGEELYQKLVSSGYSSAQEVIKAGVRNLVETVGLEELKVRQLVSLLETGLEEAEIAEEEEEEEDEDDEEENGEEEEEEDDGEEKKDAEEDEEEEKAGKTEDTKESEKKEEPKDSKAEKKKAGKPKGEEVKEEK
ncbi:MAG: transcription termination factor NusA [Bacteroidota bacterium]|jgi:N utilization substance protein A